MYSFLLVVLTRAISLKNFRTAYEAGPLSKIYKAIWAHVIYARSLSAVLLAIY